MIHSIWMILCYQPLYNALLFFISIIPGGDIGIAIILLTILVKLVLFPLAQKAINTQMKMQAIESKIKDIKEKFKDKTEQTKQTLLLYKENNVNPFSSFLLLFIQIPIIIALYWVFLKGFGSSAPVPPYSFLHIPDHFNIKFLGFIDMTEKNIYLAIIAGITQFIQGKFAIGRQAKPVGTDMKSEFARSMQSQTLYFLPIMITFFAWKVSAAVALYWITSNIFIVGQEIYTARKIRKEKGLKVA